MVYDNVAREMEEMSSFLFKKEVDQSLLRAGLTIPATMHGKVQDAIGKKVSKGQRVDIKIILEGQYYDAILTNINFSEQYSNRTVLQIRYSEGSPICQKLKALFLNSNINSSPGQEAYIEVFSNDDRSLEFKVKSNITGGNMRDFIEKILNEYVLAKTEPISGHPLGAYFRNDIPIKIYGTGIVNSKDYLIEGSVGKGNWAMVPWVCIFDRSITTTATKGVYIV